MRIAAAMAVLVALSAPAASAADAGRERARLEPAALAAAARAHLERALARDHEQLALEPVPGREPVALPAGTVTLETRACGRETPARRMCVWVDILVDGVRRKSVPVWLRVEARRKVLVATEALPAGSAVGASAFALELRDVAALSGAPLAADARTGPLRLRRPLDRGQALLASDVEPAPAVTRNQDVTVLVRTGAIQVEAPGVALSDGKLGAVVRVRNPRSGEIYHARIVDDGVLTANSR
jgi:flagellar basal body P-ring formation protein FlgA